MVVDLSSVDAVRAYTKSHAEQGLDYVTEVVRNDRQAMIDLIGDLTQQEADERIDDGAEYSVSMVLQHLNGSFERSTRRIWTLSQGQPFHGSPGTPQGGGLPDELEPDFTKVRDRFIEGSQDVLTVLEQADPATPSDITAPHVLYGAFNWLEWAIYSHHVHASDHIQQIRRIKGVLRGG